AQDPRWASKRYDMIVAPAHDQASGDNVFEITGSPHRIAPHAIAEKGEAFKSRLEPMPSPRICVLVGGRSKAFDLDDDRASLLADQVAELVASSQGSVLLTFSRRTPDSARSIISKRLAGLPGWIWDGEGDNPLFGFLRFADHILVTQDSANMAAEAAATGKPVYILPMTPRTSGDKFARLHEDLEARGAARPFSGVLDGAPYAPLEETDRAAHAVLEAMATR
ncbi:hypothetical protein LTR94_029164, partial [Friedmanniomyces endolithicus]